MNSVLKKLILFLFIAVMVMALPAAAFAATPYVHDPMDNPKAAQDIIVNPDAVYGYSPNPESKRLGGYAKYDWTDEAVVAEMRQDREEYHESVAELYDMIKAMKIEGKSIEDIARAVSTRRNEIRLESYKDDPEGLATVKKSNLETYGNENGGTPEYFYNKYGDWATVLEKAMSTNPGADAVLGLYDKYYDTYIIEEVADTTATPEAAAADTAATPETAPTTPTTIYVVKEGDCLNKIAGQIYGDRSKWTVIYNNNRSLIKNPDLIYPGQELAI